MVALLAKLFVAVYGKLIPDNSVKLVPSIDQYTRSVLFLFPTPLKTVAASNIKLSAFLLV